METPTSSQSSSEQPAVIERVLVVAGGEPWSGELPPIGAAISYVIAADSGVELALQLGLPCTVVVGDMDSAAPEAIAEAERLGARIERHPVDKESTDLELAMDMACATGARQIVVLGGSGGRISHFIGNAALLAGSKYADINIRWLMPRTEIHISVPGRPIDIEGHRGDLISLIPIGGDAAEVSTAGLQWPLHDEVLRAGTTRGISNTLVAEIAAVSVGAGTLLVVHEAAGA